MRYRLGYKKEKVKKYRGSRCLRSLYNSYPYNVFVTISLPRIFCKRNLNFHFFFFFRVSCKSNPDNGVECRSFKSEVSGSFIRMYFWCKNEFKLTRTKKE